MTIIVKRANSYLTMTSTTNVVLSSWLQSRKPLRKKIIITIPFGQTIGGTNGLAAFTIDSLLEYEDFDSIIINNYGEIQGYGAAVGGAGGHAVTTRYQYADITFNNYGSVRAGGGSGATGGIGGWGNWITGWGAQKWATSGSNKSRWYRYSAGCTDQRAVYNNVEKGYICQEPYLINTDGYIYTYGSAAPDPFQSWNYIKRSKVKNGAGGAGGAGGRGKGFNQSNQNGVAGSNGTSYGGKGGKGGTGGWWGADGAAGTKGSSGSYFFKGVATTQGSTRYSRKTNASPTYTPVVSSPGSSFRSEFGGLLTLISTGLIQGPSDILIDPPDGFPP